MTENTTGISNKIHIDKENSGTKRKSLSEYPDVMDIEEISQVLGVSTKTSYAMLHEGKIAYLKVGRAYRIPKASLTNYLSSATTHKSTTL